MWKNRLLKIVQQSGFTRKNQHKLHCKSELKNRMHEREIVINIS